MVDTALENAEVVTETVAAPAARNKQVDAVVFCETHNRLAKQGKQAADIAAELHMNKNSVLTRASMYRGQGIPMENLVRGNKSGGGRKFNLEAAIEAAKRGSAVVIEGTTTETEKVAENAEQAAV